MQACKFAAAVFVISLFLSACSSPSVTTAVADRPTLTATQPIPSPESLTPSLSPTATEAAPALEVVEWHAWAPTPAYEGSIPDTFVQILVHNPYDYPVKVFGLAAQLVSGGEIVHQTRDVDLYLFADVGWNMILPGESVPGQLCVCLGYGITESPEWDTITLSADVEQADTIPYTTELDIHTGSFTRNSKGTFVAQGTVTNLSGQPLRVILMRVIARDASGQFMGSGFIGVIGDFFDGKYQSLEAGSRHEFPISVFSNPNLPDGMNFEVTGFGVLAEP